MLQQDIVPESQVNVERLRNLFTDALLKAEIDKDGDVKVITELGTRVFVSVDDKRKLLKFLSMYRFRKGARDSDKLKLVNTLNDEVVFSRFSVLGKDLLVSDYFLSYEAGILPFQIVNSLRWFSRVTVGAIREYDTDNLVE